MVPQCSLLLLHPPLWVTGRRAVRKLSLPSQRLLGIQWSRLKAGAVTHAHTNRLDHQHTASSTRRIHTGTHTFIFALPSYSSQSINSFIPLEFENGCSLSFCYSCCPADFQETVFVGPHQILRAYRCGANLVSSSRKQSLLLNNINSCCICCLATAGVLKSQWCWDASGPR